MIGGLYVPSATAVALIVWAAMLVSFGLFSVPLALLRPESRKGLAAAWAWNAVLIIAWAAHWLGALHGRGTL